MRSVSSSSGSTPAESRGDASTSRTSRRMGTTSMPRLPRWQVATMAEPRLHERSTLLDGAEIEGLWAPAGVYLNTASYGLPPRPAVEAVQQVIAEWQGGRSPWETWTQEVGVARE